MILVCKEQMRDLCNVVTGAQWEEVGADGWVNKTPDFELFASNINVAFF